MNLELFIKKYNINKIKEIEENDDKQFLSLKKCWDNIKLKSDKNKLIFLYMILQNSIVSFQLN
jgi:hypothetical protein